MEKYLIDTNKNRLFAHARRYSDTQLSKDDILPLDNGTFIIKINTKREINQPHIKVIDNLG